MGRQGPEEEMDTEMPLEAPAPEPQDSANAAEADRQFAALLDYLKRSRGFDFTGYKRASLERRIRKRMQMLGLEAFEAYTDHLEVHPQEFTNLFNTVLINVTGFFRDPVAWEYVAEEILPRIIASKQGPHEQIRVWCAGTASGEEAYTVAMVLCEALGEEAFRDRVKIYATDVDDEALLHARQATYTDREVALIPPGLVEKYFERNGSSYHFRKDLRLSVIFGRHDLVQDAPISRVDLLVCRNTLMYFNQEAQTRILTRFNFALDDDGFLFLGRAEMLFTHANLFVPVDLKRRVFKKVTRLNVRDRLMVFEQNGEDTSNRLSRHVRFREMAFESSAVAQLAVDLSGFLTLANERARGLFGITNRDLGRPLPDLEFSYRLLGLRPAIEQAYAERRPNLLSDVEWVTAGGDTRYLEIHVIPLLDNRGVMLGVGVTVSDRTGYQTLQQELERTSQELETAYEELQSSNEELETTNEELQSTIEELETTNEELQSTNEELETMNEELQSTNEELHTLNDELSGRTEELREVNGFLESVLTSLHAGVAVLDRELRVRMWNRTAEDQWGLRMDEVTGQHFWNLDIGLPTEQLRPALRACLAGDNHHEEMVVTATNRRGKQSQYRVSVMPLNDKRRTVSGVIVAIAEDAAVAESLGEN